MIENKHINKPYFLHHLTGGKTVNFTHYASGQVKTATPEGGQAIAMEYNLQGHRTKLTDPDAGVITSRYDGWGQLVQEKQKIHITADSIVTAYSYSPSGLLNYKLRNGEYTNYRYDTSHRLSSISIAGKHAQGFAYDSYDRIIQSNDTVDGKVFVRKTEYDALGNVYRETYPGGYYTVNQYDKYGYLTTVTDKNSSNIWKAVESNARGQLTRTQSGNKETTFGFDSRGFPTAIVTPGITNWAYTFNNKGNLTSRKDDIVNYRQSLTYDSMNRLTNWNIYQGNNRVQAGSMTYNPLTGNIQNWNDLENYTMNYGENGKPHALTSISGIPGGFPTDNQNITYTDFKKVKTISEGTKNYSLTYGVDEQRLKSVYKVNNVIQKTRYYMGNYEEEIIGGNTKRIHYLSGGNGLAAIYVQNNSMETLYYAHTDYQGSLIALSLADGTVKERYAYDPWGNRRNPSNWTQKDTRTALLFNRGYTMHEHLPEFSLINMNGRVYDPLTAMFLSPDPYVQAPENWLNYNRYSYVLNNPFKYTDPSGELFGIDDIILAAIVIGAATGGYTGYKVAEANGYDIGNWQTWGYMLGGAVIGGASGYLGATTAAGGGLMANTAGIVVGSSTNSMGMAMLSEGMISPSASFGVASFDFGTGELGYLGKKDNNWYENFGYLMGSMANLKDLTQIMGSVKSSLYTAKDSWHSHNGLVGENGEKISFGPERLNNFKDNLKAATLTKSTMEYEVNRLGNDLTIKGLEINKFMYSAFGKLGGWKPPYNVFTLNCSNFASVAMWLSGIPNIGFYPYLTHVTTWFSMYAKPELWSYQFLYK